MGLRGLIEQDDVLPFFILNMDKSNSAGANSSMAQLRAPEQHMRVKHFLILRCLLSLVHREKL